MATAAPRMGDDVRKKVWNNTAKLFRFPNNQIVLPFNFTQVAGWDVWKDDDVVSQWLRTGALTEDEPLVPEGTRAERKRLESFTTPLSPAPSVFSGKVEPPSLPSSLGKGGSSPQKGTASAQERPARPPTPSP